MPVHELLERVTSAELAELKAFFQLRAEEHDEERRSHEDKQERERKLRESEQRRTLGGDA